MGCVYVAEHTLMGRKVAVKMIHAELAHDATTVQRFLTEARAVNDIRHPNIVEVTDFGQVGDGYYLIMELLEGETLGDRLDRVGVISPADACHIGAQVAAALSSAHERGFVHRDLKPQNIFLTSHPDYPDYVKVLDFGITKLIGHAKSDAPGPGQTQTGMLIGTPHYMSPEQCMSDPNVGAPSDIYALGVVLYEMVTGTVPFTADSFAGLILAHLSEPPLPPAELNPDVPQALSATLMRALEKKPEQRFESMRAFREALLVHSERKPVEVAVVPEALPAPVPRHVLPAQQAQTVKVVAPDTGREARASVEITQEQQQRVSGRLARIVVERIQSNTLVLPTLPDVALRCLDQLADDNHTMIAVAETLSRDPLLATQVLKVANSVAYGGTGRVATLEQAVARLGDRRLKVLLIELSTRRVFESKDKRIRVAFQGMWEHSLSVGVLARDLCRMAKRGVPEESAYLAGLLHDAGKPMVGALLLEAEKNLTARDVEFVDDEMWIDIVNTTHREVGVAVADSWRLPKDVVRAIALAGRYDRSTPHVTTNYVCLANALAKRAGYYVGAVDDAAVSAVIDAGKQLLGLGDADIDTATNGLAASVGDVPTGSGARANPRVAAG